MKHFHADRHSGPAQIAQQQAMSENQRLMEHTILCPAAGQLCRLVARRRVRGRRGRPLCFRHLRVRAHVRPYAAGQWRDADARPGRSRQPRTPLAVARAMLDARSVPAPMVHCATMLRLFKTCLILLLMTVVPLHAATAGIGLACASAMAPAASPPAVMAMAMAACHGQAAVPMPTTVEAAKHRGDSGTSDQHAACSACGAACMGAFMPPPMPGTPPILAGAENVSIAAVVLPAGIIPDGVRRPPRRQGA